MKVQLFFLYYGFYRRSGKSVRLAFRLARYRVSDSYY
jgi:hypothetical protein